ncbi:hypothetical protein ACQKWADRAFT_304802 [Trichoderma austrokoningii]
MQFSIMTVLALAAVAIASPTAFDKRQTVGDDIPASTPSMTDSQGNVVPFSSKDVHLGTKRGVYIKKRF